MKKNTLTIKEVARRAGVSIATVSRAMNNSGPVSTESRKAIEKVVAKSGFRLNGIGQQLKTSRSRTLGVLVPSLKNPIFADAVSGVEHIAEQSGFRVLLASSSYKVDKEISSIDTFLSSRVEGLVLTVTDEESSHQALSLLESAKLPFVLMFNPCKVASYSTVSIDNRLAAYELVSELINKGHQRIAMIAGHLAKSDRSVERYAGYEGALHEHGLNTIDIVETGFENPDLGDAVAKLTAGEDRPTAYFCSTDLLAISTIRALTQLGLKVPDDASVVGFDGISIGESLTPNLTTAVQPAEAMGNWAASHLISRIEEGAPAQNLVLPHYIRTGESWSSIIGDLESKNTSGTDELVS
ncbi:MAG: substrate-binding domain-containing protein [Granulosicoccaceae bacterium]